MALERKANKRFRILEDYEGRQDALEAHAVRLILQQYNDPNSPMIPAVSSAFMRKNCNECYAPFWGNNAEWYCSACQEANELINAVEVQINAARREVRLEVAKAQLERIREIQEDGGSISDHLNEFDSVNDG